MDDVFVGTFSAPFPTVVPEGVAAYEITGKRSAESAEYISCNVLAEEGKAIPANTGVLLVSSESQASVTMLPATTEAAATPNDNLLVATGAEGTTVGDEVNAYILANKNETVAFYLLSETNRTIAANKAYLANLPAGAVLKLNFGALTGIEGIEAADADNAPVYDLSGRKVANPVKGGIYVKNGKKIIF